MSDPIIPPTPQPLDGGTLAADPPLAFLTDDQLRAVYARVEAVEAHMAACCGTVRFGGRCRYEDDHERLQDVFKLAGAPDERTPLASRAELEAWLADRDPSPPARRAARDRRSS